MLIVDGALAGLSLLQDDPNFRHSMPTKVAEYMARGVPVITTPLPLAVDLVEPHECGFVVPFGGVPEAAAAALALREDPALRDAMGARGHAGARQYLRWPEDARAFVTQLEQWAGVTGSGPSARAGFTGFRPGRPIGSRCAERGAEPPAAGRPSPGGPTSGRAGPGRPAGAGLDRPTARADPGQQAVYAGPGGRGSAAADRRARLPGRAVVRRRLLRLPRLGPAAPARSVQVDRLLADAQGARAVPQPDAGHDRAAPDGPGHRGLAVRAAAAGPGAEAGIGPRHGAGAAERFPDRARAHDHGGHAVHVPARGGGHDPAVAAAPVVAGRADRRPAHRLRGHRVERRPDPAGRVHRLRDLAPDGLAPPRRDRGRVRCPDRGLRRLVPLLDRYVRAHPVRGLLPVRPGVVVRRVQQDQPAGQRAVPLPVDTGDQARAPRRSRLAHPAGEGGTRRAGQRGRQQDAA